MPRALAGAGAEFRLRRALGLGCKKGRDRGFKGFRGLRWFICFVGVTGLVSSTTGQEPAKMKDDSRIWSLLLEIACVLKPFGGPC